MLCHSHGCTPSFRRAVAGALAPPVAALHPVTWTATRHLSLHGACRRRPGDGGRGRPVAGAQSVRRDPGGRPLQKPGLHYTLYWHGPTPREEIRRAVAESLTVLGLNEHQAVLVGRDGPVPHVHVVVNRVSHRDGRAASMAWTGLKLSRWRRRWEHVPPLRNPEPPATAA